MRSRVGPTSCSRVATPIRTSARLLRRSVTHAFDSMMPADATMMIAASTAVGRYLIGPEEVLELERRAEAMDLQVVGYYHSHPDAAAVLHRDRRFFQRFENPA